MPIYRHWEMALLCALRQYDVVAKWCMHVQEYFHAVTAIRLEELIYRIYQMPLSTPLAPEQALHDIVFSLTGEKGCRYLLVRASSATPPPFGGKEFLSWFSVPVSISGEALSLANHNYYRSG